MVDEIDLSILTIGERERLAWKSKAFAERDERVLPAGLRGAGYAWGAIAWAAFIGFGGMILSATELMDSDPLEAGAGHLSVIALIVAGLLLVLGEVANARKRRAFARVVPDYLASIDYAARVASGPRVGGRDSRDDGPILYTNGLEPRRWLHGYTKSDRDYMRMTGMDADTYDSNVLENDKD